MKNALIHLIAISTLVATPACSSSKDERPAGPPDLTADAGADVVSDTANDSVSGCSTAIDCAAPAGPCQICDDAGTVTACPSASCVEGTCVVDVPQCPGVSDASAE